MAGMSLFFYRRGTSRVHLLDVRVKLILFLAMSMLLLMLSSVGLLTVTVGLIGIAGHARLPFKAALRESRYFGLLLVVVFAARAVSTPGDVLWTGMPVPLTKEGLIQGGLICWRLVLVVLAGMIFTATSPSWKIKHAVEWLLTPVPWLPQKRIATMIGLIMRFIPVIFFKAGEIGVAQRARCITDRKNPWYRLKMLALPLFRSVFKTADHLADAMAARGYADEA